MSEYSMREQVEKAIRDNRAIEKLDVEYALFRWELTVKELLQEYEEIEGTLVKEIQRNRVLEEMLNDPFPF